MILTVVRPDRPVGSMHVARSVGVVSHKHVWTMHTLNSESLISAKRVQSSGGGTDKRTIALVLTLNTQAPGFTTTRNVLRCCTGVWGSQERPAKHVSGLSLKAPMDVRANQWPAGVMRAFWRRRCCILWAARQGLAIVSRLVFVSYCQKIGYSQQASVDWFLSSHVSRFFTSKHLWSPCDQMCMIYTCNILSWPSQITEAFFHYKIRTQLSEG
jgi:hypothetical protein